MHITRIAMIAYHTCPAAFLENQDVGGLNTYVWALSQALAEQDIYVDVFTRRHDEMQPLVTAINTHVNLIHLPAGPSTLLSIDDMAMYLADYIEQFIQHCQQASYLYTFFHCHYYLSGLVALGYNEHTRHNIPMCVNFHTFGHAKNRGVTNDAERASAFRLQAEQTLTQQAQWVIANCRLDREYLQDLCHVPSEKIRVIAPGVNTEIFKHGVRNDVFSEKPFQVLFVGRTQAIKGLENLLQALQWLEAQQPGQFKLTIIGTDANAIAALAAHLNLTSMLRIIPQMPPQELATYYHAADVLMLPSYYESYGLVALEALACGTPAIVTENCGISDLIRTYNPQWVMQNNTPPCLIETLSMLKDNPSLLRVNPDINAFDWSHVAREFVRIYKGLEFLPRIIVT